MTNTKPGIGGAPTRATSLPDAPKERKTYPIATGFMRYFPDAIAAVSRVSWKGNEQHNPGQPLHWDRSKSSDEEDTMMRHFLQSGSLDTDGQRHSAKMVWRALAILQKEIEEDKDTITMEEVLGPMPVSKDDPTRCLYSVTGNPDDCNCEQARNRRIKQRRHTFDILVQQNRRSFSVIAGRRKDD